MPKIVQRNKVGQFTKGGGSPRFGIFKKRISRVCKVCNKNYHTYHKISYTCSIKCRAEKRTFWKGTREEYLKIHERIRKIKGKIKFCEICKSESKIRYEWANLTGDYNNPSDYKRLCHPCHVSFDYQRAINR